MWVIYRYVLDGSAYDTNRVALSEGVGRTAHASASPIPDMGGAHRGSDILVAEEFLRGAEASRARRRRGVTYRGTRGQARPRPRVRSCARSLADPIWCPPSGVAGRCTGRELTLPRQACQGATKSPNHRCHRIAPDWFDTALNRQAFAGDPGRLQKIFSRAPLGRVGDPLDVGHATLVVDPVTEYHVAMTMPTISRPGLGAPPRSRISNIRHGSLPRRSATDDHTQGPRRR